MSMHHWYIMMFELISLPCLESPKCLFKIRLRRFFLLLGDRREKARMRKKKKRFDFFSVAGEKKGEKKSRAFFTRSFKTFNGSSALKDRCRVVAGKKWVSLDSLFAMTRAKFYMHKERKFSLFITRANFSENHFTVNLFIIFSQHNKLTYPCNDF